MAILICTCAEIVEQMTKYEIVIRDLEAWAAQIVALYEGAQELEGADDIEAVVHCYTSEIRRRRIENRDGTLANLAELKRGIRLAASLLQAIQHDEPEAMQGWRYGAMPWNVVQTTYSLVYEIVMELTKSVCQIENEYPHMAQVFDAERAAYKASLDQFYTETRQ